MDCVTCLLVGMCMLCRQDLGGSRVQTLTHTGAAIPGRPMTVAEVDSALQSAIRHYGSDPVNTNSYHRQSKLDPRFAHMGIGKRRGPALDPYNFSFGLGKRQFLEFANGQADTVPVFEDTNTLQDTALNFARENVPSFSGDTNDVNDKSFQWSQSVYPDVNPFILRQILESERIRAKNNELLGRETRELQKRRLEHRLHHLF